tara:strand:+ start:2386 stop:2718 length:333 start_codon:yes stop_codon:yes gene_type:complete
MIKHIDETGKETIYTFDEFFDDGHYSSDTNEDNIEMINDWCDKHNVGGSCESEDEDNWEYSGKDGLWLNNGEPECRMCGRQGYSMACRECDICGKFNGVGGGDCECICKD